MIIYTDENNFEKVLKQKDICLVDFFATWCGPCRMLNEELIKLDKSTDILIAKVDIDECPNLSDEFNIDAVPTMYIFKGGKPVKTLQGYKQSVELINIINELK